MLLFLLLFALDECKGLIRNLSPNYFLDLFQTFSRPYISAIFGWSTDRKLFDQLTFRSVFDQLAFDQLTSTPINVEKKLKRLRKIENIEFQKKITQREMSRKDKWRGVVRRGVVAWRSHKYWINGVA